MYKYRYNMGIANNNNNNNNYAFPSKYDKSQDKRFFIGQLFLFLICIVLFFVFSIFMVFITVESSLFSIEVNKFLQDIERAKQILPMLQLISERGKSSGYAPLDLSGFIPLEFIIRDGVQSITNGGCWNALTNTPKLNSGLGANGLYFVVCVGGSTLLDGNDEWRVYDQLIFDGKIQKWLKIDSSRNIITNSQYQVSGVDKSGVFMIDTLGPEFSTRTLTFTGPGTSISEDNNSGIISLNLTIKNALNDSIISRDRFSGTPEIPFSEARFAPSFSQRLDREIRRLDGESDINVLDTSQGIEISVDQEILPSERIQIGQNLGVLFFIFGDGTQSIVVIRLIFSIFDNYLIISSVQDEGKDPTLGQIFVDNNSGKIVFDLDLRAFDGPLSDVSIIPEKVSGQITGRSSFEALGDTAAYYITGTCRGIFSYLIRCEGLTNVSYPSYAPALIGFTIFAQIP